MKRLHEAERCLECDGIATDTHHLIFGTNRENSEKYGLTVRLCRECHRRLHEDPGPMAKRYRKIGQAVFEREYGHEEFMRIFGRNYL